VLGNQHTNGEFNSGVGVSVQLQLSQYTCTLLTLTPAFTSSYAYTLQYAYMASHNIPFRPAKHKIKETSVNKPVQSTFSDADTDLQISQVEMFKFTFCLTDGLNLKQVICMF